MTISAKNFKEYTGAGEVSNDFGDCMHRYIVHGLQPGGGFSAILAGDLHRAVQSLHIRTREYMAPLTEWVIFCAPPGCYGSYEAIDKWCDDVNGVRSDYVKYLVAEIAQYRLSGEHPRNMIHGRFEGYGEQKFYTM